MHACVARRSGLRCLCSVSTACCASRVWGCRMQPQAAGAQSPKRLKLGAEHPRVWDACSSTCKGACRVKCMQKEDQMYVHPEDPTCEMDACMQLHAKPHRGCRPSVGPCGWYLRLGDSLRRAQRHSMAIRWMRACRELWMGPWMYICIYSCIYAGEFIYIYLFTCI